MIFTAEIDACDRYDITPLHMAAEGGYYECLRFLLDAGANCNVATKYARYTSHPGTSLLTYHGYSKEQEDELGNLSDYAVKDSSALLFL